MMALGGKDSVYVCTLQSNTWCRSPGSSQCPSASNQYRYSDESLKYKYRIQTSTISNVGRQVSISDAHVLVSGFLSTGMGAVALFAPNADFSEWSQLGSVVRPSGGTTSFGAALGIVASAPKDSGVDGPCRPGSTQFSFACRFVVGDPGADKVYVYTHDRSSFQQMQVLEGPAGSRFGYAISTTAHTGQEFILVGAPYADSQNGLVYIYEWSSSSGQYVIGGELNPIYGDQNGRTQTVSGAQIGYAVYHVVVFFEVRIVVGAPKQSRALVLHTSSSKPQGSNRTVTVEGDIDGSTRNYPNSPDDPQTMLGGSVAVGLGYIYVGVPRFNHNKKYQHSVGAVHVIPYCSRNQYVDIVDSEHLGATCRSCPSPATSEGKQSLHCSGCTGIPSKLPPEASVSSGCSIACSGGDTYDPNGQCSPNYQGCCVQARRPTSPVVTTESGRHSTLLVVISILVILCFLCCCCYLCRSPSQANTLQHTGMARGSARPRVEVILDLYPVSTIQPNTRLPNDADSCVICLNDFKPGEEIRTLSCEHVFHKSCIDSWLETHTTCPLCNVQLQTRSTDGGAQTSAGAGGTAASAPSGDAAAAPANEVQVSVESEVPPPAQQPEARI